MKVDEKTDAGAAAPERHRLYEDALAIVTGTLIMALGVVIYGKAMLITGSTAGLALLLQYATGAAFWLAFSLVNLPFYILAVKRLAGSSRCAPSWRSASWHCSPA